jgi:hypothetical protein
MLIIVLELFWNQPKDDFAGHHPADLREILLQPHPMYATTTSNYLLVAFCKEIQPVVEGWMDLLVC